MTLLTPPSGEAKSTLGPFLILSSTNFSGDAPPGGSYSGQSNFGAGVMFDYYLKNDVALSLQPAVVRKGSDLQFKSRGVVVDQITYELTYLSIPLALKITGTARNRVYASAGLELNILLESKRKDDLADSGEGQESEPLELAASFGIGGLITTGRNYILIEGRYTQGLSNIARGDFLVGSPTSVKNTAMMLMAGYLFQFGGGAP
jgi:hypothetical protein